MYERTEAPSPRAAQLARAELCHCVGCVRARQGDRRDASLMLRATRIQGAGVTPAERIRWDAHIEESAEWRERVRSHARA